MKRKYDVEDKELIERVKKYHELQKQRKIKPFEAFTGQSFSLKGDKMNLSENVSPEWFSTLERTNKSKLMEYKRYLQEIEKKKDREEKSELKKRLLQQPHKIKNVSPITPSTIVDHTDEIFENVFVPKKFELLSPTSKKCYVKVKLLDGKSEKIEFQNEDKLKEILHYVIHKYRNKDERYLKGLSLINQFPRKTYTTDEVKTMSIHQAGLENGSVLISCHSLTGYKISSTEELVEYEEIKLPCWRLQGESIVEKEKFQKKVEHREALEKLKDKKKKDYDLKRIRKQIEKDKEERRKKFKSVKSVNFKKMTENDGKGKKKKKKKKRKEEIKKVLPDEGRVMVRLFDGNKVECVTTVNNTLKDVENFLITWKHLDGNLDYRFSVPYPKRIFKKSKFRSTSLMSLGLYPSGILMVSIKKT